MPKKLHFALAHLSPLLLPVLGAMLVFDRASCAPSGPSYLLTAGPYHRSFLPYARPLLSAAPPFSSYPRRYDLPEPAILQQLQHYYYYDKRSMEPLAAALAATITPTGEGAQRETRSSPLQGTMRFGKREGDSQQANAGSGPLGTMRFGRRAAAAVQTPLGTMRFGK